MPKLNKQIVLAVLEQRNPNRIQLAKSIPSKKLMTAKELYFKRMGGTGDSIVCLVDLTLITLRAPKFKRCVLVARSLIQKRAS